MALYFWMYEKHMKQKSPKNPHMNTSVVKLILYGLYPYGKTMCLVAYANSGLSPFLNYLLSCCWDTINLLFLTELENKAFKTKEPLYIILYIIIYYQHQYIKYHSISLIYLNNILNKYILNLFQKRAKDLFKREIQKHFFINQYNLLEDFGFFFFK